MEKLAFHPWPSRNDGCDYERCVWRVPRYTTGQPTVRRRRDVFLVSNRLGTSLELGCLPPAFTLPIVARGYPWYPEYAGHKGEGTLVPIEEFTPGHVSQKPTSWTLQEAARDKVLGGQNMTVLRLAFFRPYRRGWLRIDETPNSQIVEVNTGHIVVNKAKGVRRFRSGIPGVHLRTVEPDRKPI